MTSCSGVANLYFSFLFQMALMLVLFVAVSYISSDSTPSKWCAERCVNPTCHVESREYCLKHPGSVYEPKGGWCGCCPGCIIYVGKGERKLRLSCFRQQRTKRFKTSSHRRWTISLLLFAFYDNPRTGEWISQANGCWRIFLKTVVLLKVWLESDNNHGTLDEDLHLFRR